LAMKSGPGLHAQSARTAGSINARETRDQGMGRKSTGNALKLAFSRPTP